MAYFPYEHDPGFVVGARLTWSDAATIVAGTAGKKSFVRDSTCKHTIHWAGTISAALTASGGGGLDTGSEAANTWYALHVIGDKDGSSEPKVMFSLSSTSPTLPSGYEVFRHLGWFRNNGSSNILKVIQVGSGAMHTMMYDEEVNALAALSGGNDDDWTDIDCSALMPPGSQRVVMLLQLETTDENQKARMRPKGSSVNNPPVWMRAGVVTTGVTSMWSTIFTNADRVFQYEVSSTSASLDAAVVGYEVCV